MPRERRLLPDDEAQRADVELAQLSQQVRLCVETLEKILELLPDLAAQIYCLEVALGLRSRCNIGLRGLMFTGGASPAAYETLRHLVSEYLRGNANGSVCR